MISPLVWVGTVLLVNILGSFFQIISPHQVDIIVIGILLPEPEHDLFLSSILRDRHGRELNQSCGKKLDAFVAVIVLQLCSAGCTRSDPAPQKQSDKVWPRSTPLWEFCECKKCQEYHRASHSEY